MTFICVSPKAGTIVKILNSEKNPFWEGEFSLTDGGYTVQYSKELGVDELKEIRTFAQAVYATLIFTGM